MSELTWKDIGFDEPVTPEQVRFFINYGKEQAQAVQREREAAKGFIDGLQTAIMRAFENHGCKDVYTLVEAEILGYVATYNDNRKG